MNKKLCFSTYMIASIFFGIDACHAKERLSLEPYVLCKSSRHAPSNRVLEKRYHTHMPMGRWHIFDINGDGWCDWVRNGREGFRYDIDTVPLVEMIYLGTPSGWRRFETKMKPWAKIESANGVDESHLHWYVEAFGFYQPIPVYRNTSRKPFLVVVARNDAPAPPPDVEKIDVLEWDDDFDSLRVIDGADRMKVIQFLRSSFCRGREIPTYDGETLLISLGNLCGKEKK